MFCFRPLQFTALAACLCVASSSLPAVAQTADPVVDPVIATVLGTVRDPLGAAVAGARVELIDRDGKTVASTVATREGGYALSASAAGRYRLRASAATFRETLSAPVYVNPAHYSRLDLTLATPTRSDEITVTATGRPEPLAQAGAPVTLLTAADFPYSPEIQQPLRLVPGVQMTQNGQTGGATSFFLRGAESNATKVLVDGVPVNDIGGLTNFANLASVGIDQIEVQRQASSALYGSDALGGVVLLTTRRGVTPLPAFTYAVDGGNLSFFRQEADLSGALRRFDFYTGFARLNTANNLPNDAFHNATLSGNYGYTPDSRSDVRFTFRHLAVNSGQPNAYNFFLISDNAQQKEQDTFLNATAQRQTTDRWHNLLQYGHQALNGQATTFAPSGTPYSAFGFLNGYIGRQVTITGANGYSVSGQAILDFPGDYPSHYVNATRRDFVYGQTDYRISPRLVALGAFRYDAERGSTLYGAGTPSTVDWRNQDYTLQVSGDVASRFFYSAGSGIAHHTVFGTALTPRVTLAYYLSRPSAQSFFSGTKLHGSFGKGIKDPSIAQQNASLYGTFLANGASDLIAKYGTRQLGSEYSRNYDAGVEQQFGDGRVRVNATFFHNEYTNGIQYVSQDALIALGLPGAKDATFQYGAYANAQAFRALGGELETEYRVTPRLFARAGYTYLDARIQHSFSSDALGPSFNTSGNFASVPIGAFAPLNGARPFRRAPHSGYFALSYTAPRFSALLSGTLVGRRDDSTFLSDKDYGNSLLLPNRNLDGAYQRLELTGDYRVQRHVTLYANVQNLLNQHYVEAFGYPALPVNVRGGMRLTLGGESERQGK